MPARLVQVSLINNSDFPIIWQDDGRPGGFWQAPWYPSNIKNLKKGEVGTWRMESGGIMTGVEGWAAFMVDIPASNVGVQTEFISFWWERPYYGHFAKKTTHTRSTPPGNDLNNLGPSKIYVIDRGFTILGEEENIISQLVTGGALVPITIPLVFANIIAGHHLAWIVEVRNSGTSSTLPLQVTPRSEPFVSDITSNVSDLRSDVAEEGAFEFTLADGCLCKNGLWPYKKVFHEQVITASVDHIRAVNVHWYINGIQVTNNSGTLPISAFCRRPFPLPKGRSDNRALLVKYEIINGENRSTLRVFNDPVDGSYNLMIGINAIFDREYHSATISENFSGETCNFDPTKLKGEKECLERLSDKAKSRTLRPGEAVVIIPEEIWRFLGEERRGAVDSLVKIIGNSFRDDSETFTQAINQLEQEIGLAGITRLIKIGLT